MNIIIVSTLKALFTLGGLRAKVCFREYQMDDWNHLMCFTAVPGISLAL